MSNPYRNIDLRGLVNKLSPEFIDEQNFKMLEQADKDYCAFVDNLKIGKCSLYEQTIEDTSGEFCFHWII